MVNSGQILIDKAAKVCGSDAALARRLGTKPPAISELRAGKREMSPETAALLADIARVDAREAVIQAVIARNKTGPKAEQIREILGKGLAVGAAALLVFSYDAPLTVTSDFVAVQLTPMHIVLSSLAVDTALRVLAYAARTRTRTRTRIPLRSMSSCLRVYAATASPLRYRCIERRILYGGTDRVRVPQDRSKVKSKGLRPPMLTRSLRFASSCGFRLDS